MIRRSLEVTNGSKPTDSIGSGQIAVTKNLLAHSRINLWTAQLNIVPACAFCPPRPTFVRSLDELLILRGRSLRAMLPGKVGRGRRRTLKVRWSDIGKSETAGEYPFRQALLKVGERQIAIWQEHPDAVFTVVEPDRPISGRYFYVLGTWE